MPSITLPRLPCTSPSLSLVPCPSHSLFSFATFQAPACLTSSRCQRQTHRLVRWRMPQKRTTLTNGSQCHAHQAQHRPFGPCSGPRLVGFAYVLFWDYWLPSSMFLYPLLCFRPFICLVSFLLDAFAIGHQLLLFFSTLRPLLHIEIPFIFALPLITGPLLSHSTPRGLSLAGFDFNIFFPFSPTHSFSA